MRAVLSVLVVLVCAPLLAGEQATEAKAPSLRLELSVARDTFEVGEPIPYEIRATNVSAA